MVAQKLALTAIANKGTATLSTSNAKATGSNIWSLGGATEVGSGECVATGAAKVEIRHGLFAVSRPARREEGSQ